MYVMCRLEIGRGTPEAGRVNRNDGIGTRQIIIIIIIVTTITITIIMIIISILITVMMILKLEKVSRRIGTTAGTRNRSSRN